MIFISYSHADEDWRRRLERMAKPLARYQKIKFWSDRDIQPGMNWKKEIDLVMKSASVAVLLVSDHFLGSDFIANEELPYLLQAAEKNETTIFWLLISPCLWRKTGLNVLQAVYVNELTPLISLNEFGWKGTLLHLCEKIDEHLKIKEEPLINKTLNAKAFPHINKNLQVLAAPAIRDTEVLVWAGDNHWHRQNPIKAGAQSTTCYFGDVDSAKGSEYRLIALTMEWPLKDRGRYPNLPDFRTKSEEVRIKRL